MSTVVAAPAAGAVRKIVMFAYDGVELLDVAGPLEAFATASALIGGAVPAYEVQIASESRGMIRSVSGLVIEAAHDFATLEDVDTLLIAGGAAIQDACQRPPVLAALKTHARSVRRIGSVCTGAMLLAHAGLLDGRRAVTHWNWCERLARAYPAVKVESAPIFIADGKVWTSAGVTAGIDLALAMIEDDFGPALALRAARELVMFLKRPGGQSQFSVELMAQSTRDEPMRLLQQRILDDPAAPWSVDTLAASAAMSPRNLARVFKRETGGTPAGFVERARLELVRKQLEGGQEAIDVIAVRCGFRSGDVMRRAFLRHLDVSPGDYRARFSPCRQ